MSQPGDQGHHVFVHAGELRPTTGPDANRAPLEGTAAETPSTDPPSNTPATLGAQVPSGTIYTCPMHPEIRQTGPGHCPKCGMALEPLVPTAVEDDADIRRVRRRFWVAVALALPVMVISMVPHLLGQRLDPSVAGVLRMLELALSAPVVLWAAAPYYRRGALGVLHRAPNMYTLIGLGVIVAFTYSLIATFFPNQFPAAMRDAHGKVGVYFEVAAVIVALVLLGEWLELTAEAAPVWPSGSSWASLPRQLTASKRAARRRMSPLNP